MSIADKMVYPLVASIDQQWEAGITFRERLIVALASNTAICGLDAHNMLDYKNNALYVIGQADAIIKQLEEEKK